MKSYLITIVFMVVISTLSFSQDAMPVENVSREMSMGIQPGFSITIGKADFKTVQKDWEKDIKDSKIIDVLKKADTKVQFSHKGDEYIASNVIIESISSNPITVIVTIADIQEGIRVIAFFEMDSTFISVQNSKEETYLAAKNYIRSFGLKELIKAVNTEIENENDRLNSLENDLIRLRSKKEDYEKEINKNNSDIREEEASIKANLIDQERQIEKVNLAKDTLFTFERKTEEYKFFKGKLKDEEKILRKYEKSNKSDHSKIKKYELSTEKYKEFISLNIKEQESQKEMIANQKKKIKAIEQRLQKIK